MSKPRRRGAHVRVTVVAVDAPALQHAIDVAVLAGPADVVYHLVPPVLLNRLADPAADVFELLVPRDARPAAVAARAAALERIENAIWIFELIGRDDALGARAAARPGVDRVALDLANVEGLLVDVGENAARRLAVEADARNDPVAPAFLLRPAGGLEVHVVVPLRRVGMRAELSHSRSQCPIVQ